MPEEVRSKDPTFVGRGSADVKARGVRPFALVAVEVEFHRDAVRNAE